MNGVNVNDMIYIPDGAKVTLEYINSINLKTTVSAIVSGEGSLEVLTDTLQWNKEFVDEGEKL